MLSERFYGTGGPLADFEKNVAAPMFRRSFSLDFLPENATLTVCGLGLYELYLNGEEITKGPLSPYISATEDAVCYDEYDLTGKLSRGENVLGLILGNGMRNAFGGFVWDFHLPEAVGPLCFALSFEASGEGKRMSFEADERFRSHASAILRNDLRCGYLYDARREKDGWSMPGFDDSRWRKAVRVPTPRGKKMIADCDPIAVRRVIPYVSVKYYPSLPFCYRTSHYNETPLPSTVRKNVYLFDFGVNTAGVTVLRVRNTVPGQKITVRHGEYMQPCADGEKRFSIANIIFSDGDRLKRYCLWGQKDVFICRGADEEVFTPRFKYDGFRYAYVEGLREDQITPDVVTYAEMSSALRERGSFRCSDETLNQLYEIGHRSDLANFFYFPTDCPHREKNGWTGDASVSCEHMMQWLDAGRSLRFWLRHIRAAQREDGALPGIVPTHGWGFSWGNGPAWDSALFELTEKIRRFDGDTAVVEENADAMAKYLSYAKTKLREDGLAAYGLGDWVDPFEMHRGDLRVRIASPLTVTDTCVLYRMARQAEKLFEAVGREKDAADAHALADRLREAFRRELIEKETLTVAGDCQTSQAIAIFCGMFEENEEDKAYKRLLEIIERDGNVNHCGMLGLRVIFHVLTSHGDGSLAYRLITDKGRTGYGSWIEAGATALWENFPFEDGYKANSQNHHFLGDVANWMTADLAGLVINPDGEGADTYAVRPHFLPELSFAEASFESRYGKIFVRWERPENDPEAEPTVTVKTEGAFRRVECSILNKTTVL